MPEEKSLMQVEREWMSRPTFWQALPWNIEHDVCSEGLTVQDMRWIMADIAFKLEELAEAYHRAAEERKNA